MEWNVTSEPEPGRGSGRDITVVVLQLVASVVLYLLTDPAKLTACRMRVWHYTGRAARGVAYRAGRLGLEAERRYDIVKG
jgi:hypothetical protein